MKKADLPHHCQDCPSLGKGIFCEIESIVLKDVDDHKIVNQFKKGQTLFVEGTPPFGIYCVSKGNIKLTKTSQEGKEAIVRIATAGDVLGHRSIFTNKHYSATATAIDEAVVCFIDKKYILKMIESNPSVAYQLMNKLSRDLGSSETKIATFSQKNVRERLAELLLLLKESHGHEENGEYFIDLKLTREEMASLIGTATETLIRFMSELKDEGFIRQEGKQIIIIDEKGLLDQANLAY